MNINQDINLHESLDNWFNTDQGLGVSRAFYDDASHFKYLLHGDSFIQLGMCGDNTLLSSLNYNNSWLLRPTKTTNFNALQCSYNALPLAQESVDCIFSPLKIEADTSNYLVDEIDRVLKPMGYVVFLGVNPISFWGAWMRFSKNSFFKNVRPSFTSSFSLNRIMINRGFRQCYLNNFYYVPPARNINTIKKLKFLDEMGKMIGIFPSGFYCLVMQKYKVNNIDLYQCQTQDELVLSSKSSIRLCRKQSTT